MIVPVGVIVLQEGRWIVRVVDLTRISYREVLRGRTARMGDSDREDDGDTVGGFDGQTETLQIIYPLSYPSDHATLPVFLGMLPEYSSDCGNI